LTDFAPNMFGLSEVGFVVGVAVSAVIGLVGAFNERDGAGAVVSVVVGLVGAFKDGGGAGARRERGGGGAADLLTVALLDVADGFPLFS